MEAKRELVHFEYSMYYFFGRMAPFLAGFESVGLLHTGIHAGKAKKFKKKMLDQFKCPLQKIWD